MGNIAYIITRGCYSDYEICAVTLDKDRAERLKQLYSNRMDEAEIEEWELDKGPENEEAYATFYRITIDRYVNTNVPCIDNKISDNIDIREITEKVQGETYNWYGSGLYHKKHSLTRINMKNGFEHLRFLIYISKERSETEEKAKKIAYDEFAEVLAMRGGLT